MIPHRLIHTAVYELKEFKEGSIVDTDWQAVHQMYEVHTQCCLCCVSHKTTDSPGVYCL